MPYIQFIENVKYTALDDKEAEAQILLGIGKGEKIVKVQTGLDIKSNQITGITLNAAETLITAIEYKADQTQKEKAQVALKGFWRWCDDKHVLFMKYPQVLGDTNARILVVGLLFTRMAKMGFKHLWDAASTDLQYKEITTMATAAMLGPADVKNDIDFEKKVRSVSIPNSADIWVTRSGTRLNLSSSRNYGAIISSYDELAYPWE